MMKSYHLKKQFNTDIEVLELGHEDCAPGHYFGPAVRKYHLIHYIVRGKGFYEYDGKRHALGEGGLFLISPDDLTYYQADQGDPWEYVWIGFYGVKPKELLERAGLGRENPVTVCAEAGDIFREMEQASGQNEFELHVLSGLYRLLAVLARGRPPRQTGGGEDVRQQYVGLAVEFIKNNYVYKISIGAIARHIGINRSYLYELFKEQTGLSPQQFLIDYRLEKAEALLLETDLRISDVARSVGYEDAFLFTRMFRARYGVSPSAYRGTGRKKDR